MFINVTAPVHDQANHPFQINWKEETCNSNDGLNSDLFECHNKDASNIVIKAANIGMVTLWHASML